MFNISVQALSNYLYQKKIPLLPKIIQALIFFLFNSHIPYQTIIGRGTRIGHRGIAVVINKDAIIGENVLIRPQVVIGGGGAISGAPKIGNNVKIGAGAKIIGGVTIGHNSLIGANAVVTRDVPPNSTAIGIPATIKLHNTAIN